MFVFMCLYSTKPTKNFSELHHHYNLNSYKENILVRFNQSNKKKIPVASRIITNEIIPITEHLSLSANNP